MNPVKGVPGPGDKAIVSYTGRRVIIWCVQEPIAEPGDYNGRETGRNPANGDKIRA
jgi:hypothetical protein